MAETHVNELLEHAARRFAERTALAEAGGGSRLSYAELRETVARYARRLREAGLGRGSVVAVRVDRSLDTVPVFLATQWIGAAYLPIDERLPAARVRFMIEDAGCDVLVLEDDAPEAAEYEAAGVRLLGRLELRRATGSAPPEAGETAYILYTSGSTGLPKAVPISAGNLSFFTAWLRRTYTAEEVACTAFTISVGFDVSFAEILAPLVHGGTLVVYEDLFHVEGTAFPLTSLANVPGNLSRYLERCAALPATLRVVTSLGEPLRADLARRIMAGGARLINAYGPTEATIYTTHHEVSPADLDTTAIPIGLPFDGVTAEVLRPDGTPCADGEPGELVVTGPNVSSGYLSAHAAAAGSAFSRPPGAAYPTYRTGDIVVRAPSGVLTCLGRSDRQCKVNGIRVDLQEVTSHLLSCAGVANGHVCAVAGGQAGTRLVAFVTAESGQVAPRADDVQAKLAAELPRYSVPHDVFVVPALPTTLSGKIDEAALLAGVDGGVSAPATTAAAAETGGDAVAELLALCTGGDRRAPARSLHSLTSLEIVQLRQRLFHEHGTRVPLREIYQCADVTALAELVRRRRGNAAAGDDGDGGGDGDGDGDGGGAVRRCGPGEQNIWLADMLDPEACGHNEVYRLAFARPVTAQRVEAALRRCVRDFPALRTAYRHQRGGLVKEIADASEAAGGLPLAVAEGEVNGVAAALARQPFDLAEPLKIRARYLPGEHPTVLLNIHHIAIDAVSVDVILERLEALLLGQPTEPTEPSEPTEPTEPSEPTEPAVNGTVWSGPAGQQDLREYWEPRLARVAAGDPAPVATGGVAERREATLTGTRHAVLRRAAAAARTSLFGLVHATLTTVLGRRLGVPTVSLGTPVTRRAGEDRSVGCFTTVVPLVAAPRADEPPPDYLALLRRELLDAIDHSTISLGELRSMQARQEAPLLHALLAEVRKPAPAARLFDAEEVFTGVVKMPLMFLFEDRGDALRLVIEYAPAADSAPWIASLLQAAVEELDALGAAIVNAPRPPPGNGAAHDQDPTHSPPQGSARSQSHSQTQDQRLDVTPEDQERDDQI